MLLVEQFSTRRVGNWHSREAIECGWNKTQLERQIQTSNFERIIAHHGEQGLLSVSRERLPGEKISPVDVLKSPMVLEFLDLPDVPSLHESELEQAIINNLQFFLLEPGKGFSFVDPPETWQTYSSGCRADGWLCSLV